MPLELSKCSESDLADFTNIQNLAFNTGMASYFTPRPITPERFQKSVDEYIETFRNDPECQFVKVVDTDTGKMIACAKWRFMLKERSEEEMERIFPKAKDDATPAVKDFLGYLTSSRKEWMGTKPFYFLHILVTLPEHHRRGAGAMLVKWGIEQADRDGLPTYLEASDMGRPLYERLGFYAVKETFFDLAQYGSEHGTERNTAMLRDAPKP